MELPVNVTLEARVLHRIEMAVLNGFDVQPAPNIFVRTFNKSGPYCGENVSLHECISADEVLEHRSLEQQRWNEDRWQNPGEEALLIRLFRLATASQVPHSLCSNMKQCTFPLTI